MAVELQSKPEHMAAVLPRALYKEFFSEVGRFYGVDGMKNAGDDIICRALSPLTGRVGSLAKAKNYFFTPYKSWGDFGWSLLAGPCAMAGYTSFPTITFTLLALPAFGELFVGIYSLIKAAKYAMQSQKHDALLHLRDGLTRLALSPFLALLCFIQMPVEFARFITRLFATLVDVVKQCFSVAKSNDKEATQPMQQDKSATLVRDPQSSSSPKPSAREENNASDSGFVVVQKPAT